MSEHREERAADIAKAREDLICCNEGAIHKDLGRMISAAEELTSELDALEARVAALTQVAEALQRIADAALTQNLDWMHFHETAMTDPFAAESEAQRYTEQVRTDALAALDGLVGLHEQEQK